MSAMFLDSLIESDPHAERRRRWPTFVSFLLQMAGILVLVLLPLFYTGALPAVHMDGPVVMFPANPTAKPHVEIITVHDAGPQVLQAPRVIPPTIYRPQEPEVAPPTLDDIRIVVDTGLGTGTGTGPKARHPIMTELLKPATPVVPTLTAARPRISTGVSEGMLLQRVAPRYPYAAIVARIEGTVVLTAVISSEGKVEQLRAQSGHPFLIAAALDAVRQWRYRPYLLNGKPTDVEAQITVAFHLQH